MGVGIMVKPSKYFRQNINYSGSQASLRKSGDKERAELRVPFFNGALGVDIISKMVA